MSTTSTVERPRRFGRALLAAVTAILAAGTIILTGAAAAQATDSGGDGSPTGCSQTSTVATVPIHGSRGALAGKAIGELQLRWSWSCHGNWSRVVLYGGMYSNPVTVEQVVESEGRRASAYDPNLLTGAGGTSAWSPYIRLANSQSTACVQAWLSSDFGTLNYHTNGARFCV
ncbi:hypothetical protein [Micromonospora sp. RL09-050-HVF-A]|uniref:hypothetical protein n=1 Tax=Micromonospora sp. RL09-050-HVF-A TaxID=1703433 RepID=UPI001C5DF668|nr:hypothetical protein [Micromonospora sp. RL09-050-HVF-A]MBW4701958.1 hypothetical protein [Micromonospora sp. RL09-050-HVF-A]